MVHISPVGVWSADQDAVLTYTVQEDFMSSTWDWVGLYKVLTTTYMAKENQWYKTDLNSRGWCPAGGIQECVRLWDLCLGEGERAARDKWSHTGKLQMRLLNYIVYNENKLWVQASLSDTCVLWLQISVDKDEIPLLGGQYVLGYYSTNMQSILGLSSNFQVRHLSVSYYHFSTIIVLFLSHSYLLLE